MSKLVFGVGVNDGSRPTKIDGKKVKEYGLWQSMLERCFSEKLQTRYPTYKGCSVSTNFLNYSFFYDWCKDRKSTRLNSSHSAKSRMPSSA